MQGLFVPMCAIVIPTGRNSFTVQAPMSAGITASAPSSAPTVAPPVAPVATATVASTATVSATAPAVPTATMGVTPVATATMAPTATVSITVTTVPTATMGVTPVATATLAPTATQTAAPTVPRANRHRHRGRQHAHRCSHDAATDGAWNGVRRNTGGRMAQCTGSPRDRGRFPAPGARRAAHTVNARGEARSVLRGRSFVRAIMHTLARMTTVGF